MFQSVKRSDQDCLHVLPLSAVPLKTRSLQRTRMIKNTRLEGVVEVFADQGTGSGQIPPNQLPLIFEFDSRNRSDLEIIDALSKLASYDVYTLRVELRRLNISVNEHECLTLSEVQAQELSEYMTVFTRPLVSAIYGGNGKSVGAMQDIVELFNDPDVKTARDNLTRLAKTLDIEISHIPRFLEDYGDIYLSLAYYQFHLDQVLPMVNQFLQSLAAIRENIDMRKGGVLHKTCSELERNFNNIASETASILDLFQVRTNDMWENITANRFYGVRNLIETYQRRIGGMLCALTVKLNSWENAFPHQGNVNLKRQADFVMSEMGYGLEHVMSPCSAATG